MRTYIAFVIILFALPARATCVVELPTLAKVEVLGCQPIQMGASPSKNARTGNARFNLHGQGTKVEGTLMHVHVLDIHAVSLSPDEEAGSTDDQGLMKAQYLFVSEQAADVCPPALPKQISVIVEHRCCDTQPKKGGCIVPFPQATVEKSPERWFTVRPRADG